MEKWKTLAGNIFLGYKVQFLLTQVNPNNVLNGRLYNVDVLTGLLTGKSKVLACCDDSLPSFLLKTKYCKFVKN